MDPTPFTSFDLAEELLEAINDMGFESASPIQAAALPALLEGKDLVGHSPTGSGKTAAFALPILQRVDPAARHTSALVLCPTRELAVQVSGEFLRLGAHLKGVHTLPVYGGTPIHRQIEGLRRGAAVVIGTPGRVLDLVRRGSLDLSQISTLVLDEADEMLDMGFIEDIETILQSTPDSRQTVCFSATMPKEIRRLIDRFSKEPVNISVAQQPQDAPDIEQVYYEVRFRSKPEVVSRLLDTHETRLAIVFCNTKRNVDTLSDELLARGYAVDRLHGDLSQAMRDRVMDNFRRGSLDVLVATDVAGRGLDVPEIDLVINYDLPFDNEDYIHRIGRTGRAGRSGKAISLIGGGKEIYKLQNIQRHSGLKLRRENVPTLDELENQRADIFYNRLHSLLEAGGFATADRTINRLLEQEFSPTDITAAALHLLMEETKRDVEEIPEDRPGARRERGDRPQRRDDRPPRDDRPYRDDRPPRGDRPYRDDRPPRGDRPSRDDRPPRDDRPYRDDRPPRGDRPYRDDRPPRDDRPYRDDRPPRDDRRPAAAPREGLTRLFVSIGSEDGIHKGNIAGMFYKAAHLPEGSVGAINVGPRHSTVDIPSEHASDAIHRLREVEVRGLRPRVDYDREK